MKIEAIFEKFLRISETKSAFLDQKTTISNCYGKNSNKNISDLFESNYNEIMYQHTVTECRIC